MEPYVYESDKAIVRIHKGKLSEEELHKVIEKAAIDFYWSIQRSAKGKVDV